MQIQLQDFSNSFLKIRWKETDRCHLLMTKDKSSEIYIGEYIIKCSDRKKLLGIKTDSKLRFDDQVQDLCKKAKREIGELACATH